MKAAQQFFYDNAGYSYDPSTQTEEQGRAQCAARMAEAEAWARDTGCSFEWMVDPYLDSSEWDDSPDPWRVWTCCMHDAAGVVVASSGCVDFGRDGSPWTGSYRRVVEAELALEAKAN